MPQFTYVSASLSRRFAAFCYELFPLTAIWLTCTLFFLLLVGSAEFGWKRLVLQGFLWLTTGAYFVRCWTATGQTLAAQAWKIKLVNGKSQALSSKQAAWRYVLASLSLLAVGLGFVWALFDRDRQFLHDRLLETRWVFIEQR